DGAAGDRHSVPDHLRGAVSDPARGGSARPRAGGGDRGPGIPAKGGAAMRRLRETAATSAFLLILAGTATSVSASPRSQNEEGNRLYRQKQYKEAQKKYSAAQLEAPNAPQLHYNLGNVLFRQGEVDEAREEYRRALAIPDPSLD